MPCPRTVSTWAAVRHPTPYTLHPIMTIHAPDTLDLRDHAALAIRHMTANHDVKTGYPYFYLHVHGRTPSATHNAWDTIDVTSRYIDSLILTREMTADTHGADVEERYRGLLLENIHPADGLAYR